MTQLVPSAEPSSVSSTLHWSLPVCTTALSQSKRNCWPILLKQAVRSSSRSLLCQTWLKVLLHWRCSSLSRNKSEKFGFRFRQSPLARDHWSLQCSVSTWNTATRSTQQWSVPESVARSSPSSMLKQSQWALPACRCHLDQTRRLVDLRLGHADCDTHDGRHDLRLQQTRLDKKEKLLKKEKRNGKE